VAEDLQALKRQIEGLEPHEKLVLAGNLLEQAAARPDPAMMLSRTRTAYAIARDVVLELGAALALHDVGARRG
jgi:hypothetical protein